MAMRYRRFGRTGLDMPVLTCGGMRYQHSWKDDPPETIPADNQENLERTVRRALELGINHIETARGYGTSEIQLGRVLPTLPRDEIIVQTKVFPREDPKGFLETFELSMANLRLGHVDLFSIHGINNEELLRHTLRPGGCLDVARRLQRDGRVRFIGFSSHAPAGIILRAIEADAFDYVNLHWYFVNDFNWPAIEAAARRDMGVFIISPNDKGGKLYEAPEKLRRLCEPLSPMAFNVLYCLARPEVHTLSIGAARPGDFDGHVAALEQYDRAAEVANPIAARLRAEMERVLGADWCGGWWRGIPEYTEAPGQINLLEILRLWTLAKGLDLVEFGRMRYNLIGNAEHWFPGSNASDFDEAAVLAAVASSPFRDRIPGMLREAHEMLKGEQQKRLSQT